MDSVVGFDWGGVLMQTKDRSLRFAWDQQLGLEPGTVETVVHGIPEWRAVQLGQIRLEAYWQAVSRQLGINEGQTQKLKTDFYAGDELDTSLVTLIRQLKAADIQVGLMSNNITPLRAEIEHLGLVDLFDTVIISAEIQVMKPDPGAYVALCEAMQVSPESLAFVDDFEQNILGAQALGIYGVHYRPGMDLARAIWHWLER